ncbi:uncharacterized protein LOC133192710 [Saccostrea echinata]|uniref:uncharacterized protein LOC133192710 n=1 Tax=Saccostrea echinata TaxID=191078 RepID=UPI002A838757|nr:uncharacterized protein LOC133192710 [Saccostrea echinata]
MAILGRFYVDALFFMAILISSFKGTLTQDSPCVSSKNCGSSPSNGGLVNGISDEIKKLNPFSNSECRNLLSELFCRTNAYNDCKEDGQSVLDDIKKRMMDRGCSGAGLPVFSVLCLLAAALFHTIM